MLHWAGLGAHTYYMEAQAQLEAARARKDAKAVSYWNKRIKRVALAQSKKGK